jgi:hypothetical protein
MACTAREKLRSIGMRHGVMARSGNDVVQCQSHNARWEAEWDRKTGDVVETRVVSAVGDGDGAGAGAGAGTSAGAGRRAAERRTRNMEDVNEEGSGRNCAGRECDGPRHEGRHFRKEGEVHLVEGRTHEHESRRGHIRQGLQATIERGNPTTGARFRKYMPTEDERRGRE